MLQTDPKPKPCKVCGTSFLPFSSTAVVCSVPCAKKVGPLSRKAEKADRKLTKQKLEKLKPLSHWAALAQTEVNRYVRLRDRDLVCVSCDRGPNWDGQWHASHLRSRGAAPQLRFHLWNLHRACSVCNNHLSGNLAEYGPRLRARIGDEKVDWLYSQNEPVKHTREYLQRLASVFRRKANRLEARL